jgi:carboxymethylenebutenolidase
MHTESIEQGYLALPDGPSAVPGIVVVHDVWGLYEHFRDVARRLAGFGFAALAVDLYRRLGAPRITDPAPWMQALSDPDMLRAIQEAVDVLRAHPSTNGRVGIVGFCMGGMYAWLAGTSVDGVSAIAPFYGILSHHHGLLAAPGGLDPAKKPREPVLAVKDLRCPAIAFYGSLDEFVTAEDIEALRRNVATVREPVEIHLYEGAGHAFANDTRPAAYRPEAARDAWERFVAFFRVHLSAADDGGAAAR